MDIAALSMELSQMKVARDSSISVLKMAMDTGKTQMNDMIKIIEKTAKTMERSITPHLGGNVDVRI